MNNYKIAIETIQVYDIEADSPENAIKNIKENLVKTQQIKPSDVIKFSVIQENERC